MTITISDSIKIVASDGTAGDRFGTSVDISGDIAIVGAVDDRDNGAVSGSAYIFEKSGATWTQKQKLVPGDAAFPDLFGISVGIDNNQSVIGSVLGDGGSLNTGNAYIFEKTSDWNEVTELSDSSGAPFDQFGVSVSISGDIAIVGAQRDDGASGSAFIFEKNSTTSMWEEKQKLTASDAATGDFFGTSVSISGDIAIIGATGDDDAGSNSGSAYIFEKNSTTSIWEEKQKLTASDAATADNFGSSVSIDGNIAIIGAPGDDDASGSAYIFEKNTTTSIWEEKQKLTASDGSNADKFGSSVSIDGNIAIIGAADDDDAGSNSGSAYIFEKSGSTWDETAKLIAFDGAANDSFGRSVSINNNRVIVGASGDDTNPIDAGSAYIFDLGAACIFNPVTINALPLEICLRDQSFDLSFTVSVTSDTDEQTYTYSITGPDGPFNGTGTTGSNPQIQNITVSSTGIKNYTLTITPDDSNCTIETDSVDFNITVIECFDMELFGVTSPTAKCLNAGTFNFDFKVKSLTTNPNEIYGYKLTGTDGTLIERKCTTTDTSGCRVTSETTIQTEIVKMSLTGSHTYTLEILPLTPGFKVKNNLFEFSVDIFDIEIPTVQSTPDPACPCDKVTLTPNSSVEGPESKDISYTLTCLGPKFEDLIVTCCPDDDDDNDDDDDDDNNSDKLQIRFPESLIYEVIASIEIEGETCVSQPKEHVVQLSCIDCLNNDDDDDDDDDDDNNKCISCVTVQTDPSKKKNTGLIKRLKAKPKSLCLGHCLELDLKLNVSDASVVWKLLEQDCVVFSTSQNPSIIRDLSQQLTFEATVTKGTETETARVFLKCSN